MANVFSALRNAAQQKSYMAPVDNRGGWWPWIREPSAGAWQKGEEWCADTVAAYHAVYACITLISADIGKMPFLTVREDQNGIWNQFSDQKYSVLRKPNRYQNHIQFKEWWITSKLFRGNTYGLKERASNGAVKAIYVLDPTRVQVLVSSDGSVYYQLGQDELNGQEQASVTVPASEIIHDRMNCLFHPLVGVSPLYASGLAASQGMKIQNDSDKFFANGANPGGVLTAPGAISDETAKRLKARWDSDYTGSNAGKVAVLGDGLKFEPMRMTAVDAQLIQQLRWTAEVVCSTFHVPAYKIGVGDMPTYNNIDAQNKDYYSQCLQSLIESMELCLDEGLEFEQGTGVELDLDVLFRMDSATQIETLDSGVSGKIMTHNEARKRLNLPPIPGGDTIYLQQQDYSMAAIAARDEKDPLAIQPSTNPPATQPEPTDEEVEDQARAFAAFFQKEMTSALNA
ncbi:MAG: phage portal protein [Pseudomonadales bacterium]|nr:phage portal protein [Pseudomonadales bacterium]|tara:strand:- start:225 stop:1592 length:1368 start_codon:yes stop_codon:yes gene_type:complete